MSLRHIGWLSIVAGVLFLTPLAVLAQIQIQLPQGWPPFPTEQRPPPPKYYSDEPRGPLEVMNDWQDQVTLTLWSHRRERIGQWVLNPGATNTFEDGGRRIKVRPQYKIKVGEDWGWVDVGQVGEFHNGVWFVRVRDIWRATHGARQRGRAEVPDWRR